MKKNRIFLFLLRFFNLLFVTLISVVLLFVANGYFELKPVETKLELFRNRCSYVETITINNQIVNIYRTQKLYDYENTDKFIFNPHDDEANFYIGSISDIIITNRNPLRRNSNAIVKDVAGYFSENFYIGHATCNTTSNGDLYIESVLLSDYNGVRLNINDWIFTEVRASNDAQRFICLRSKSITSSKEKDLIYEFNKCLDCKYNPLFFIKSKNKYYCTDLISRCYEKIGININYDGFFPTGNDFIISDELYPIFICERIDDYFDIYYLGGN